MKEKLLKVGDIIELCENFKAYNSQCKEIKIEKGCDGKEDGIRISSGLFVVWKAHMCGGSVGSPPGGGYPDGWKVYCTNILHPEQVISFFQSGSFTIIHKDIDVIGHIDIDIERLIISEAQDWLINRG